MEIVIMEHNILNNSNSIQFGYKFHTDMDTTENNNNKHLYEIIYV